MPLAPQIQAVVERIVKEFNTHKVALNTLRSMYLDLKTMVENRALLSHTHKGIDITSTLSRGVLPQATESLIGVTRYATNAEAQEQVSNIRALTPANLASVIGAGISTLSVGTTHSVDTSPSWYTLWNGISTKPLQQGTGLERLSSGPSTGTVRANKAGLLIVLARFVGTATGGDGGNIDLKISATSSSGTEISGSYPGASWQSMNLVGAIRVSSGSLIDPQIKRSGGTGFKLYGEGTNITYILIPD